MDKVLISACLLGRKVRYDGKAKLDGHDTLDRWQAEGRLVPFCPEVAAGMAVPRPAAEIVQGDGTDVLAGRSRIVQNDTQDVTELFIAGARQALEAATRQGCRFALLTDGSPSCGSGFIYDGTFRDRSRSGQGVTATLLREHGVKLFTEKEIPQLDQLLR